jgi:hypothetical protein
MGLYSRSTPGCVSRVRILDVQEDGCRQDDQDLEYPAERWILWNFKRCAHARRVLVSLDVSAFDEVVNEANAKDLVVVS